MQPSSSVPRAASAFRRLLPVALLFVVGEAAPLQAQAPLGEPSTGPVIEEFGPVFLIPFLEVEPDREMQYRVVFDVAQSSDTPGEVNRYIESVARFLNMQARAGVSLDRMQLAVVLHGSAAKDALRPGPFAERYGTVNRNADLLESLAEAGVEIYLCGQSAMSRGLPGEDLLEPVQVALSAMTTIAMLKKEGFVEVN